MNKLQELQELYENCYDKRASMYSAGLDYSYSEFKEWAVSYIFNYIDESCRFDLSSGELKERTDDEVIEEYYHDVKSYLIYLLGGVENE